MRRTLVITLLSCAAVFTVASCGASSDVGTAASTTTTAAAGGKTSTTKAGAAGDDKKANVNPSGPKCSSAQNFLVATYYASTEGAKKENADKANAQLDSSVVEVKKNLTQFQKGADLQVVYWKKVIAGGKPTDAEKAAQEKAKNEITQFVNQNCKKADGATTTTAKK